MPCAPKLTAHQQHKMAQGPDSSTSIYWLDSHIVQAPLLFQDLRTKEASPVSTHLLFAVWASMELSAVYVT